MWYKFGVGMGMGLQDIGSRAYPWYGNHHTFECVVPLLRSQVIAEVVMCLYSTFIVCFSIFLLVSITLVLEIANWMLPWKPHASQVASYLSEEDLFNQIWLSFNFSGEIYAATPSTNLTALLGRRISLGLLLKESVRKFPQFYLGRRSVILAGNN